MKQKITFTVLLLLFSLNAISAKESAKLIVLKTVLKSKSSTNKSLTIKGNTYLYRMNRNKSFYNESGDEGYGLTFKELQVGQEYFFTLHSIDGKRKNAVITFVSSREPFAE